MNFYGIIRWDCCLDSLIFLDFPIGDSYILLTVTLCIRPMYFRACFRYNKITQCGTGKCRQKEEEGELKMGGTQKKKKEKKGLKRMRKDHQEMKKKKLLRYQKRQVSKWLIYLLKYRH